jgi:cationic peptide transport system substrate-binding protein
MSCAAIDSQTNYAHWCNREFDSVLQKALATQQLAARIDADGSLRLGHVSAC